MVKAPVHKKFTLKACWGICLLLIFGTATMISSKFMMDTQSFGCKSGEEEKKYFDKALYQSWLMLFGMAFCLPIYWVSKALGFQKEEKSIMLNEEKANRRLITIKNYCLIAIPALFDLVGSTLLTTGLIYISASVMQMLRGSMIIFSSLLTVFVRKVIYLFKLFDNL
jgi:drug/metabolite transporter (DMT)-like permease